MLMVNDLRRQEPGLLAEIKKKADDVIGGGRYVLGPHLAEFEKAFAAYCGTAHCVGVANGTDALELSLRAVGVGVGDKVLTVANAGGYATVAILAVGAKPAFVEIDPDSMLVSPVNIRESIDPSIRAIIVTHLYGQAAAIGEIAAMAGESGIPVIEDCAQAHGAMLERRRVGSLGTIGCFSFYPTKNLGAVGDGGAIVTNDAALGERVRKLRQYGWKDRYEIECPGGRNSRMDELQAAILIVKLPYLDGWNRRRLAICRRYVDEIRHPAIRPPEVFEGSSVGHLFVVRTPRRASLRRHLESCGIMSDIHYPVPDYLQPALCALFPSLSLPSTETACAEVLTLPCFPEMSEGEISAVVAAANGWPGS